MDDENDTIMGFIKGSLTALLAVGSAALGSALVKYQYIQKKLAKDEELTNEEKKFLRKVNEIRSGLVVTKKFYEWDEED